MAYCLTIRENNNFRLLDISLLDGFERLSKFKDCNSYSLNEIDKFTSCFDNEIAFRKYLYNNGIIRIDEITKDISIRMKNKEKLVKVDYGLVFSDSKKYFDEVYLKAIILRRQNDYEFLNKLLARYRNSYCNNENIAIIRNIMLGNNNNNMYRVLSDFVFNEIYNRHYDKQINQFIYNLKYKSLHDLAVFVYNYENKYDEFTRKHELLELKENLLEKEGKCLSKKKKRVKKYSEIEGQLSIYDL